MPSAGGQPLTSPGARATGSAVTDPWIRRPSSVILHAAFVPRRATCVLVHCSPPRSWRWSSRWPPAGVTTARPRPRSPRTTPRRRPPPRPRRLAPTPPTTCSPRSATRACSTVSTDPAYPPQSSLNEQTGEYEGFDIDVATEIAKRLGVDVAWEAPAWEVITAGSWNGRWDMSVGLDDADQRPPGGPRLHRALLLHAGRRRGARGQHQRSPTSPPTSTARRSASAPAAPTSSSSTRRWPSRATRSTSSSTTPRSPATTPTPRRSQDLALGDGARLDAVMTSLTTAQGYIDAGNPVKIVGDPLFYEPLGGGLRQELGPRRPEPRRRRSTRSSRRCTPTARSPSCRRSGTTASTSPSSSDVQLTATRR